MISSNELPDYRLGRIAYQAYCETVGNRSVHGEPLPSWTRQCEERPAIAFAWVAAAKAARAA